MKHVTPYHIFESNSPKVIREYYPGGAVWKEEWFLDGKRHRVDGPAMIKYHPDGSILREAWYVDGKLHHKDGPAIVVYYLTGEVWKEEWFLDGERHRVDGPAWLEYRKDGSVEAEDWYLNDTLQFNRAAWTAQTPGLSQEELVRLHFEDPDQDVRRAASRNPKFPEDLEGWAINLDDWT